MLHLEITTDYQVNMLRTHPALFQDPKTHHPIYNLELPFADYITECQNIIAKNRTDLQQDREKIIAANSPFEFKPHTQEVKGCVLMVHGLLESPFSMRDIGMKLQEEGYLVRGILLPGHGTIPGDLLSVDYKDWIQAVRYGIASFKKENKKIYLIGSSTGASLALYHVLHQAKLAGVVLISPAIKIRSNFDFSSGWYSLLSWAWERAKWLTLNEENDYVKYQSITFNAAYQVYRLTRIIKKISKTHTASCPAFYAISMADATVSASATIRYFMTHPHPKNQMLIYSSSLELIYKNNPNTLVRTSVFPEMHIKEFSHISLPISPDNLHYGRNGDYLYASHINDGSNTIYGGFSKIQNALYAFLYQHQLSKLQRKRLTFNPDFDYFVDAIKTFISNAAHPEIT